MTSFDRLHQYSLLIRWDKPIGTLLLLWPTLTALLIATAGRPSASLVFIFVLGVFVMRSAGCIINDIIDIKFDKHVLRTQSRPLTNGNIKILEASIILAAFLVVAFGLVLFLNLYCLLLAIIGVVLTVIYPFMKRFFKLPQGVLGLVWSLGILMAFAASQNTLPYIAWFLFFIAIIWTIAFDTLYAMSDRDDDIALGLKSSAIWFGKHDRCIVAILQSTVVICLLILGLLINAKIIFYLSIIATLLSFLYQQWLIKDRDRTQCLAAFINNQWSWFFIFFGVYLSYLVEFPLYFHLSRAF